MGLEMEQEATLEGRKNSVSFFACICTPVHVAAVSLRLPHRPEAIDGRPSHQSSLASWEPRTTPHPQDCRAEVPHSAGPLGPQVPAGLCFPTLTPPRHPDAKRRF